MGHARIRLVGRGWVKFQVEMVYGFEPSDEQVSVVMRALERRVPTYYTRSERTALALPKLWREEKALPFITAYCTQQLAIWALEGRKTPDGRSISK